MTSMWLKSDETGGRHEELHHLKFLIYDLCFTLAMHGGRECMGEGNEENIHMHGLEEGKLLESASSKRLKPPTQWTTTS